jgi:hypothetical protein
VFAKLWRVAKGVTYRGGMGAAAAQPLSRSLAEAPGCWLAVDRATNEIRAMADTPYALAAKIAQERITGVAVVRAPDPSEPELVGLG